MSKPAPIQKAGGLYGGIKFSSATTAVPSTANSTNTYSPPVKTAEPVVADAPKPSNTPQKVTEKDQGTVAESGGTKAAAGIHYALHNR